MKTVIIIATSALLAGCGNLVKSGAIVEAQNAVNVGDYVAALESTEIAEAFGKHSASDIAKLYYLRGQSLEGLGRIDDATLSYQHVVQQYENSAYAVMSQRRLDAL